MTKRGGRFKRRLRSPWVACAVLATGTCAFAAIHALRSFPASRGAASILPRAEESAVDVVQRARDPHQLASLGGPGLLLGITTPVRSLVRLFGKKQSTWALFINTQAVFVAPPAHGVSAGLGGALLQPAAGSRDEPVL